MASESQNQQKAHLQLQSRDSHPGNVSFESHANREEKKAAERQGEEELKGERPQNEGEEGSAAPKQSSNPNLISDPVDQVNLLLGFQGAGQTAAAETRLQPRASREQAADRLRRADSSEVNAMDIKGIPLNSSQNKEPRLKPGTGAQKERAGGPLVQQYQQASFHKIGPEKQSSTPKASASKAPSNQSQQLAVTSLAQYRANDVALPPKGGIGGQKATISDPKTLEEHAVMNFLVSQKVAQKNVAKAGADLPKSPSTGGIAQEVGAQTNGFAKKHSKQVTPGLEMRRMNKANVSPSRGAGFQSAQKQPRNAAALGMLSPPAAAKGGSYAQKHIKASAPMSTSLLKGQKAKAHPYGYQAAGNSGPAFIPRVPSSSALAAQHSSSLRPQTQMLAMNKQQSLKDRKGSATRAAQIETPAESKKAMQFFQRIGYPNLYKLDKLSYSRAEVADIGIKLSRKLDETEHLLEYERKRNDEMRNQKLELQGKIQELTFRAKDAEGEQLKTRNQRTDRLAGSLQDCLSALKDSMIHNFMYLDFYKEIQEYVSAHHFEEQSPEVAQHLAEVNRIIESNNLDQIQYDTEVLEKVRDECADFLRQHEVDTKKTVTIDLSGSAGDAQSNIDVRDMAPILLKSGLDAHSHSEVQGPPPGQRANQVYTTAGTRLRSSSRGPGGPASALPPTAHEGHDHGHGWDKHHAKCITDSTQILRSEVHAKQLQISKLQTERDQLKRRVIELKAEIQKVKEKAYKKAQVESLRGTLEKKEKELYIVHSKALKQVNELECLRAENLKLSTAVVALTDGLKMQEIKTNEYRSALESEERFESLRTSVNHVTGMLVSKAATALTAQQRTSLQAIFGDSAVLHTLRHRLAESERYGSSVSQLLSQSMKLSHALRTRLSDTWKNFSSVIKHMDEVALDEVNHYQLLVIKNLFADKYTPEKVDALEAQLEADVAWHSDLRTEYTNLSLLEDASRQIVEGATLLGSFVDAAPGRLNQSVTSQSGLGGLRNKSIPARQRQKNLASFGPAQAQVQTAQKAPQRKRSNFLSRDQAASQSQIIDFTPPTLMEDDGSGVRRAGHQEAGDAFADVDYSQRRDRASQELDANDFRLQLRSASGSPLGPSPPRGKHKTEYAPRESRQPGGHAGIHQMFSSDDLIGPGGNDDMLISQNSSDFINVSGPQDGQTRKQDANQIAGGEPDDQYIVVGAVSGPGAHIKTRSSASDYMEFECDQPMVGYSPSGQRVTPKQSEGEKQASQFKQRPAEPRTHIQHSAGAAYQNATPPAQAPGNFSARPRQQQNADTVSEYAAIGNQSHTVKRKRSQLRGDLKLQDDSLSSASGLGILSLNTSKNYRNDGRAFGEVASSIGVSEPIKIDGLFKQSDSSDEERRSKATSPARGKKAMKRNKSKANKRLQLQQENEQLRQAMGQIQNKYSQLLLDQQNQQEQQQLQIITAPQKQEDAALGDADQLLTKQEDDSLLAGKLDDAGHVGELLQAGDFETSESPQLWQAVERDPSPDFLSNEQPRQREFTFSGKEDWDGK